MIQIRSALFSIGYFVSGIVYGTLSVLTWILPPLVRHKIVIYWTYFGVAWLRYTCSVKHKLIGTENLAAVPGPVIVMSKHQSTWETLFLQQLFFPAVTVLKKELVHIPFFGWGLRALRPIAIYRSNPRQALKQVKTQGVQRLAQGYNLVLFPEGTRAAPGERLKYARSGADIAIEANIPIIPVALNSGVFWPRSQHTKVPGTIEVHLGEAIFPEGKTSRQLIEEVENWIENKMQTLPERV